MDWLLLIPTLPSMLSAYLHIRLALMEFPLWRYDGILRPHLIIFTMMSVIYSWFVFVYSVAFFLQLTQAQFGIYARIGFVCILLGESSLKILRLKGQA